MEATILASAGRSLWRYLDANSIDADALFRQCGLDPALIREPRTRYPFRVLAKVFLEAARLTRNENIGLQLAQYYSPLDLNALGVTFLSSATLTEAIQRLQRYVSIVNTGLEVSVSESDGKMHFLSAVPTAPDGAVRVMEDSRAALLISLCRLGLDQGIDPAEVAFTYPEPAATGDHFAVFRCPLKFAQPVSRISFKLADMQRPLSAANRDLALSSDQILETMLREFARPDIVSQVKRAIIEALPSGAPSEEAIARRVCVSGRTLQRKLAEEGTSYRTLLSEVRRDLAAKYIADKSMPLSEISYMLGFSDASSFSRAFKKWTGDPPAAFRSQLPQ
ncbi:MAG: AraC family transcriptional regulator [Halioglobus sp.]|nr:AraC family transcriptional regulator [Halioglobus sp.]